MPGRVVDINLDGQITEDDIVVVIRNRELWHGNVIPGHVEALHFAKEIADAGELLAGSKLRFVQAMSLPVGTPGPEGYFGFGPIETPDGQKVGWVKQELNPEYWVMESGMRARLRPGLSASAALDDIVAKGHLYSVDCGSVRVIAYYLAIKNEIGAAEFDRGSHGILIDQKVSTTGLETTNYFQEPSAPGDYVHIRNDATSEVILAGWSGENLIYVGLSDTEERLYYGHPYGMLNADAWIIFL